METVTPEMNAPISLWKLSTVIQKTSKSRSSIYSAIQKGTFPAPVKLGGPRASAWASTEVQAWIDQRVAERDGGQSA